MQPGQTLVGEVQVAVGCKEQIVDALEARAIRLAQKWRDSPAHRIEQHDADLVVGDENGAR